MSTRKRARRVRRRGYTIIEVMMAVGIMTVGAVGIMSLQQAATRGNSYSRQMSVATELTRTWLERLRRDALQWNQSGLAGTVGTDYLSNVPAAGGTIGAWLSPIVRGSTHGEWPYADFQGLDTNDATNAVYCTQVRLRWVIDQQAIRADVRTWWHRTTASGDALSARGEYDCTTDGATIDGELSSTAPRIHAVHGSMLLRWTPMEGT